MSASPHAGREPLRPLYREGPRLRLLDQRLLPLEERWLELSSPGEVADAIADMAVRGAPAIGVAAAYGAAFAMRAGGGSPANRYEAARSALAGTRPTARNLFAAIERMDAAFESVALQPPERIEEALLAEADRIAAEDEQACRRIGALGAALLSGGTVMTLCNAGALATAAWGTALGIVRSAVESGQPIRVLAPETRPYLQGSRLTAWELARDGIPVEVITDGMAGHFLASGEVAAVLVGADRIAANGDVANKIGTYSLAVLARENGVAFYVAAPTTTIDLACPDGSEIPIEQRAADEVLTFQGARTAPAGVGARYPAFDVTPARYVTAIVTDRAVCRPPYTRSLAEAFRSG